MIDGTLLQRRCCRHLIDPLIATLMRRRSQKYCDELFAARMLLCCAGVHRDRY